MAPEVLDLREVPIPELSAGAILVHAQLKLALLLIWSKRRKRAEHSGALA